MASEPEDGYSPADIYSLPPTRLLSIEHPAILTSIDAGVRTLGGTNAIVKVAYRGVAFNVGCTG
jgi:hypothetical protein